MNLANKVIVITGAGSGLGKSIAIKVAALGAQVALIARTEGELLSVQKEIRNKDGVAEYFVCDVSNRTEVEKTIKKVISAFKTIDILVNNAGIWTMNVMEEKDPDLRRRALEINTLGPIQVTEEILPLFRKNNQGWIFNVISSAAHIESDVAFSKVYAASKWGLEGYAKALRDDLKNTKIVVSDFFPGGFDSMLYEKAKRSNPHNQPWMMKTDDVADIVLFMLTRPENMLIKQIVVGTI